MMDEQREIAFPAGGLAGFVLKEADRRADRTALIDAPTGRTASYKELASAVRRVASSLHGRGVAKGDVFAMWCPNSPEFVIAYYAALSIGAQHGRSLGNLGATFPASNVRPNLVERPSTLQITLVPAPARSQHVA